MNYPLQPRSRAVTTPTATTGGTGGRFPLPTSASTSGSRPRRGFTPRSASRTKPIYAGPTSKPKLTPQQQLEIMQRLEAGNFKKGVGIAQFYEEFPSDPSANNNEKLTKVKQNLFSSFVSVDPLASSTRNYGNGVAGSMESLISVGSSVLSSTTVVDGMDVTSVEVPTTGRHVSETDEYYRSLPDYIKDFGRLLASRENYYKKMEQLAEIQCSVKFAQLLPQEKMVNFFKSLERIQKIIQTFLDGNASENMKLFMPSTKPKGPDPPVVHCDVECHSQIINAFYKLSEIMSKLDLFLNHGPTDLNLDAKIESFKDLVNKLEDGIRAQEEYSQSVKDIVKKTEILDMDETSMQDSETDAFEESPSP